jgi:hypothetical protein
MLRTTIAYLMIVMMIAGAGACILYLRHHSHARSDRRRVKREHAAYERRMAAREHE